MIEGDDVGGPVWEGLPLPVIEHVRKLVCADEELTNVAEDEQNNDPWKVKERIKWNHARKDELMM